MDIGGRLRELRKKRGWTQAFVAAQVGVQRTAVTEWEANRYPPGRDKLIKLAELFDVPIEVLLGREERPGHTADQLREEVDLLERKRREIIDALGRPWVEARSGLLQALVNIEEILAEKRRQLQRLSGGPVEGGRCVTIPLLGTVRAGVPTYAEELREGEIEVPYAMHADYALRVRGDSMVGAGIFDGDIAICRRVEHQAPKHRDIVVALVGDTDATLKILVERRDGWYLEPANPNYEPIRVDPLNVLIQGVVIEVRRSPDEAVRLFEQGALKALWIGRPEPR